MKNLNKTKMQVYFMHKMPAYIKERLGYIPKQLGNQYSQITRVVALYRGENIKEFMYRDENIAYCIEISLRDHECLANMCKYLETYYLLKDFPVMHVFIANIAWSTLLNMKTGIIQSIVSQSDVVEWPNTCPIVAMQEDENMLMRSILLAVREQFDEDFLHEVVVYLIGTFKEFIFKNVFFEELVVYN